MTHNSRPTRAEAADVANAVLDGSDAVMLSGETAAGEFPAQAVATMSRIAHEAERILHPHRQVDSHSQPRSRALVVTEAVTLGASRAADHLEADLVVVATRGGKTAMAMSRQRSHTPILGVSDSPETARRMCLYWGVTPLQSDRVDSPVQDLLKFIVDWCLEQQILQSGNKLVLVTSTNWSAKGHDLMLVHAIP
jgi:pyruvate kinase